MFPFCAAALPGMEPRVVRGLEGEKSSGKASKRPRTRPSRWGVGPMDVRRMRGVRVSLRMEEGES